MLTTCKTRDQTAAAVPLELTFDLDAFLKLQFLCHIGETEVGGFGITLPGRPLRIHDVALVQQSCTAITVEFDDRAVSEFFETQVDLGRKPEEFARVWIHTHPGESAEPSATDEETFSRVFGRCDWAVMFILARGGQTYCRLAVNAAGLGRGVIRLERLIPVRIDWSGIQESIKLAPEALRAEHAALVRPVSLWEPELSAWSRGPSGDDSVGALLDWFDQLDPAQQDAFVCGLEVPEPSDRDGRWPEVPDAD